MILTIQTGGEESLSLSFIGDPTGIASAECYIDVTVSKGGEARVVRHTVNTRIRPLDVDDLLVYLREGITRHIKDRSKA